MTQTVNEKVGGMIFYDNGDYYTICSDRGKKRLLAEVIVGCVKYSMPLLGQVLKADYPELSTLKDNIITDKALIDKIEKHLL